MAALQKLNENGLEAYKNDRKKELEEMKVLNNRLVDYISKTNFYEAENKKLEEELAMWRSQKGQDLQPIKDRYEKEIETLRLSLSAAMKSQTEWEAKCLALQKEVSTHMSLTKTQETQIIELRKKIDSQSNQLGDYEGEMHTLRLKVASLEDDNARVRELLESLKAQNRELRNDLDLATVAQLEAESLAEASTEEAKFYKEILAAIELSKAEVVQVKGMDSKDYWNSHIKKALREINSAYDDKVALIQADAEAKFQSQIARLKSGDMKNQMAATRSQEEIKKLRVQLSEKSASYQELMTKLAVLQADRDDMFRRMEAAEGDLADARIKFSAEMKAMDMQLSILMHEMNELKDAKLSMELEIATYKNLLEGEEVRVGLRGVVEDKLGAQSSGAAKLASLIS